MRFIYLKYLNEFVGSVKRECLQEQLLRPLRTGTTSLSMVSEPGGGAGCMKQMDHLIDHISMWITS